MKKYTLAIIGLMLGGMLISQQLYSRSAYSPDGDLPGVEQSEKEIKVFPNPSDGRFQLTLEHDGTEKVSAKVFDITGKQIKDISEDLVREDTSVTAQVNLESPKSGIYFLRVSIGNKVLTKKIIIR
ncbi:MAG: T9SS type A sorting domain-containing protein [Bacteroidia bacterium]|nr:MAG: T9SS type A sorting domain-containing protein [Bacteroidia bacterium]